MPSINVSAKHNLSLRTGVDLQRINTVTKSISSSIWNDWKTPEECAKKWAIDLGVSEAEIWRYFFDAVVIENN